MTNVSYNTTTAHPHSTRYEALAKVEPIPPWDKATMTWGAAWPIHRYGSASGFLLLTMAAIMGVTLVITMRRTYSRNLYILILFMIAFFASSRTVFFFVDPYGAQKQIPVMLCYLMLSVSFPTLTNVFVVLFAVLWRALHPHSRGAIRKLTSSPSLISVVVINYVISIVTDIAVALSWKARVMAVLCQCIFVLWGLLLTLLYVSLFRDLRTAARKQAQGRFSVESYSDSFAGARNRLDAQTPCKSRPRGRCRPSAVHLLLVEAILFLLFTCTSLWGLVDIASPYRKHPPEPWPWLVFVIISRGLEVVMCVVSGLIACLPARRHACWSKTWCSRVCLCCWRHEFVLSPPPSSSQENLRRTRV